MGVFNLYTAKKRMVQKMSVFVPFSIGLGVIWSWGQACVIALLFNNASLTPGTG